MWSLEKFRWFEYIDRKVERSIRTAEKNLFKALWDKLIIAFKEYKNNKWNPFVFDKFIEAILRTGYPYSVVIDDTVSFYKTPYWKNSVSKDKSGKITHIKRPVLLPLFKFPEIVREMSSNLNSSSLMSPSGSGLKKKIAESFARSDSEQAHLDLIDYITSNDFITYNWQEQDALDQQLYLVNFVTDSISKYSTVSLNKLSAQDIEKLYYAMCEWSSLFRNVADFNESMLYSLLKWRIKLLWFLMKYPKRYQKIINLELSKLFEDESYNDLITQYHINKKNQEIKYFVLKSVLWSLISYEMFSETNIRLWFVDIILEKLNFETKYKLEIKDMFVDLYMYFNKVRNEKTLDKKTQYLQKISEIKSKIEFYFNKLLA